jgi:hypothetical protein
MVLSFHCSQDSYCVLVAYNTLSSGRCIPPFRWNLLPPSAGLKGSTLEIFIRCYNPDHNVILEFYLNRVNIYGPWRM